VSRSIGSRARIRKRKHGSISRRLPWARRQPFRSRRPSIPLQNLHGPVKGWRQTINLIGPRVSIKKTKMVTRPTSLGSAPTFSITETVHTTSESPRSQTGMEAGKGCEEKHSQHNSPPSRGQASCGSVYGSVAHSN